MEGDGVRQDQVEGLGETALVQGLALAELLGGAQGRWLPALLAGGGELAIEGVIPGHFSNNGSGCLQGGGLWL
jgi:hypothetical protein